MSIDKKDFPDELLEQHAQDVFGLILSALKRETGGNNVVLSIYYPGTKSADGPHEIVTDDFSINGNLLAIDQRMGFARFLLAVINERQLSGLKQGFDPVVIFAISQGVKPSEATYDDVAVRMRASASNVVRPLFPQPQV